jgi:hypothetical protein
MMSGREITEIFQPRPRQFLTVKLVTNCRHGHRRTRQLHRSLTDVRRGGFFLDGRSERRGEPKRQRSSIALQRTDAIPSAADIKRDALSIVEVGSTYVGLCIGGYGPRSAVVWPGLS